MRKLTKDADRICRSNEVKEVYQNFEKSYDVDYLTETLGFPVLDASSYERNIALQVVNANTTGNNLCMAAFPNVCGQIYIVINNEDVDKAHQLGLQLMYI